MRVRYSYHTVDDGMGNFVGLQTRHTCSEPAYILPARIRCKAIAKLFLKLRESLDNPVNANRARIVNRTATKGGKARAEYHRRIELGQIANDTIAMTLHAGVEHRQYQPVLYFLIRLCACMLSVVPVLFFSFV
jgi:hypothetical protein